MRFLELPGLDLRRNNLWSASLWTCLTITTRACVVSRWNKYLAKFVNSLCKHMNKRLAKEAASQTHVTDGVANGHAPQGRQHLSTDTQRSLARVILRMADKAQYSKVGRTFLSLCAHVHAGV